jgi:lipopolysaccharide/colanic/teichoic acid biosynthesis glycosyltransferase
MSAPLFEFRTFPVEGTPSRFYAIGGKRLFDLCILLVMSPVVVPVMLVLLVLAAIPGGRPLYSQDRVGRDGAVFRCWKFRSMVRDADAILERMLAADPALAAEWLAKQKLSRDPRVTRFGAFLRRTSLDELPQLWNVLNGTMSLVGPRPFMPAQRAMYQMGAQDVAYYRMRPGVTGLWQISARSKGNFAERATYDTEYWNGISLVTDLWIMLRTASVVLRGTGV